MSIYGNLFTLPSRPTVKYSVLREEEEELGVDWLVQFELQPDEFDDSFDSDYREEVVITAVDIETANKYAQQYIRTMQLKSETADAWKNATVVSIDKQ